MKGYRFYKAAAAALLAGSVIAACSSSGTGFNPLTSAGRSGSLSGKPGHGILANLGNTQSTVTGGTMVEEVSATFTAGVLSFSDGTVCGGTPDPCAISNHANWPSLNVGATDTPLTAGVTTLTANCAGAGTGSCYIVAYEGGVGPYVITGPAVKSGSNLVFPAISTAITFQANTLYNFFVEYATGISASPPPVPPTAQPSPTFIPTQPPPPQPSSTCGPFSVLSTNPNYSNVHFEHTSVEYGDVGMNGAAQAGFHIERSATINGTVHTAPGELVQVNGATITGGFVTDPANVAAAVSNAESLSAADAALTATQNISSIDIGNRGSQTIDGSSGVNVLDISSLEMGHDSTLTLNAPAGSTFVINLAGEMKIGNTAQILLAGGITAGDVTFNFPGSNGQIWVQFTSVVNGTILAPYRTNLHVDHTSTVNGAVVGDGAVMEFAWGDTVGTHCGIAGAAPPGF